MADVPQIVRQRLKAAAPPATHPDADVLTAFSERALSEAERITVMDHLSRCSDCREIVALAFPQEDPVQITHALPERRLSWPVLRWGFIAAGIAIIASLGILQYQRHNPPTTARVKTSAAVTAATEAENKPAPASTAAQEEAVARDENEAAKAAGRKAKKSASEKGAANQIGGIPAGATLGGPLKSNQLVHGPKMPNQWQQNANAFQANANQGQAAQTMAAAPAPASNTKQQLSPSRVAANAPSSRTATPSNAPSSAPNLQALVVQSQSLDQLKSNDGVADTRIDRAKPPLERQGLTKVPASFDNADASLAKAMPAPRWTINASGSLQRSYDQGRSWQDVSVSAPPAAAPSTVNLSKAYGAASKDASAAPAASPAPQFRAVAANGSDVWAGGSSGMLYHSTDAGSHWTRIVPSSNGVTLTGDVLSVDFPDPQHGKVSTSTSELWTTSDAGQSWQKQ